jgi:hypothetical protein
MAGRMSLSATIAALEAGEDLHDADRAALLTALKQYRRGEPFHLAGTERIRRRDAALRRAAECLPGTPWEVAGKLESAVARFESRVLPRHRDTRPPGIDGHLWDAWQSGARMLRSRRRLYDLIR